MATYLQSTSEENLAICISSGRWGFAENRIGNWKPGDLMIAYVQRALAALFVVTDMPYYDDEISLWPDKLYPYRVSIRLQKLIPPDKRIPISNPDIRGVLFRYHTSGYGTSIVLAAKPLHDNAAQTLLSFIYNAPDWTIAESENEVVGAESVPVSKESTPANTKRIHFQMQYYLGHLGSALGYDIWIPISDRRRVLDISSINRLLSKLPSLPFDKQTLATIANIDVIWFGYQFPTHLFEVENTTNIQTGLVRMNDLIQTLPQLNVDMYICASKDRFEDVRNQVRRPTFNRDSFALKDRCRFISFERLSAFVIEYGEVLTDLKPIVVANRLAESLS